MSDHTGGTNGGTGRYSVPQAARYLGISERAVRKRIQTGSLAAERDGRQWVVFLPAVPGAAPGGTEGGTSGGTGAEPAEPIEAGYRVTPAELEQAIARTGERYVADIAALYDRVEASYREIIDAKDQTITELRRRADDAEHERDQLRERLERADRAQDEPHVLRQAKTHEHHERTAQEHAQELLDDIGVQHPGPEPETPQRGPQRAWWRFWERD